MPVLREALQQVAVHIEYVDETVRRLVDRVVFRGVLLRVGNPDLAVDVLNAERRVAGCRFGSVNEPVSGGVGD